MRLSTPRRNRSSAKALRSAGEPKFQRPGLVIDVGEHAFQILEFYESVEGERDHFALVSKNAGGFDQARQG